jgi:adenylate cyclase
MAIEIERKFLVRDDSWKQGDIIKKTRYRQGYLTSGAGSSVRVRISNHDAYLNIKSGTLGIRRHEFEYPIPEADAQQILDSLCHKPLIEKTRYYLRYAEHTWEIDVFEGDNEGLVVAEVEMGSEDESFERPSWLGREVSDDPRYYNTCLVSHPYKDWDH